MNLAIQKIDSGFFTWQTWRGGTLLDLGIKSNRRLCILENKSIIRECALGYCDAEHLLCRPKEKHKAIMFQKDDIIFWTHLTNYEFENIFNIDKKLDMDNN